LFNILLQFCDDSLIGRQETLPIGLSWRYCPKKHFGV